MSYYNLSKNQCLDFIAHTERNKKGQVCHRNPVTKRLILKDGPTYKDIYKHCDLDYFSYDRHVDEIQEFVKNPYVNPKTHKPLLLRLGIQSDYAMMYSNAYAYYNDIKMLPKCHILFNGKLDVLHYREDRNAFSEDLDDIYRFVDVIFNTFREKDLKYPKGLRDSLDYNEKLLIFAHVLKFIRALAYYVSGRADKTILKLYLSELNYINNFNHVFKTYKLFHELLLKIGKREFKKNVNKELAKEYNHVYERLFKNSSNVVQTLMQHIRDNHNKNYL